jgi:hypothetical protein
VRDIHAHNAQNATYKRAVNHFADRHSHELPKGLNKPLLFQSRLAMPTPNFISQAEVHDLLQASGSSRAYAVRCVRVSACFCASSRAFADPPARRGLAPREQGHARQRSGRLRLVYAALSAMLLQDSDRYHLCTKLVCTHRTRTHATALSSTRESSRTHARIP